jgi:hypothetical protein
MEDRAARVAEGSIHVRNRGQCFNRIERALERGSVIGFAIADGAKSLHVEN